MAHLKIKTLIKVKKLVLMKAITSLYSIIQQYQEHKTFALYLFYCNPKEKDHLRRKINVKKEMFTREINIINILISQKLGQVHTTKN